MRGFLLSIILSITSSCALLDQFIPEQPPRLVDYGYPELQSIPVSSFTRHVPGYLIVEDSTIETLGRNTAACLDKIEAYSLQVSTYNQNYGQPVDSDTP